MLEALLTGLAVSTAVAGFLLLALLTGFYVRYRVSEDAPKRASILATAVIESVWVASAAFAGALGGFIGHYSSGAVRAGFGLLIGFAIGSVVAIKFFTPLCRRITGMLTRRDGER